MYSEISIQTGNSQKRILFAHPHLKDPILSVSSLHDHQYAEVIVLKSGEAGFEIGEKTYHLQSNNIIIIPNQTMHSCIMAENAYSFAFFIDTEIKKPHILKASPHFIDLFFKEIASFSENNCSIFASYISILLNDLFKSTPLEARPISDLKIVINEYFSKNYSRDFSLTEIAEELHLSKRQAERMIVKCTGKTFKENIIERRMLVANSLMRKSNLSLTDIAKYVGYHSYSGFWKAYNLDLSKQKKDEKTL